MNTVFVQESPRLANTYARTVLQAGARRFAMTLGRATELALLVEYGTAMQSEAPTRASQDWCQRLRRAGIDSIQD
jgi:hypothetical protein